MVRKSPPARRSLHSVPVGPSIAGRYARIFVACIVLLSRSNAFAEGERTLPTPATKDVEFTRDIEPILREHCFKCHGPNKQRGDLRLDQQTAAMKGGDSLRPRSFPVRAAASPLIRFAAGLVEGMEMPPEGERRLSDDQIGLLRAWIDQGARWPAAAPGANETDLHWSFQPLRRPHVPAVASGDSTWERSPIDAFIVQRLKNPGPTKNAPLRAVLAPSAEADRGTLIRRASFDLIGLPPAPLDVAAFIADPHPDAYERLVDRLLASPHFGERWARHWMDVVKFAESDGFETNQPRPNAWHYRDYVIRSFNEDLPFDRFVFEQLAGDLVGEDAATGFLVAGAWDRVKSPDPGLTAQQRADELHDMVSTTASAFFGLTVGCARCHNHKFDPISQADYYSMKAVFAGVQHGERPLMSAEFAQRQQQAEQIRRELAAVDRDLARFAPLAFVPPSDVAPSGSRVSSEKSISTLLIDDEPETPTTINGPTVTSLIPRNGVESYKSGTARGLRSDPGDATRFPNLGRSYSYWGGVTGADVFRWNPQASGRWHLWLSWGCGWDTHAADARYLIDADGDLTTRDDQQEVARVDQRHFADGTEAPPSQSAWSGFFDAGVHPLTASSCIVLRTGETNAPVAADLICLQKSAAEFETGLSQLPRLRSSVHRQANVERFRPIRAKFLRFVIEETNGSEPCLDELEVFATTAGSGAAARNVALSSLGTRATASSNLPGHPIHQLKFVNDGRYGNSASWISHEPGRGWIQLEFAEPVEVDRAVLEP